MIPPHNLSPRFCRAYYSRALNRVVILAPVTVIPFAKVPAMPCLSVRLHSPVHEATNGKWERIPQLPLQCASTSRLDKRPINPYQSGMSSPPAQRRSPPWGNGPRPSREEMQRREEETYVQRSRRLRLNARGF